jgi:hypothetical protein
MRRSLQVFLAFACIAVAASCSSGNYDVNPNSNANNSSNPLSTKTPTFDWSGAGPISGIINGTAWVADAGSVVYTYNAGYNYFTGNSGGKKTLSFWFTGIYPNNYYIMGLKNGSQYCMYEDSTTSPTALRYYTYNAPWNTGAVQIIRSDTFAIGVAGYIEGKFYFEAVDSIGRVTNVTNGYFNVQKW